MTHCNIFTVFVLYSVLKFLFFFLHFTLIFPRLSLFHFFARCLLQIPSTNFAHLRELKVEKSPAKMSVKQKAKKSENEKRRSKMKRSNKRDDETIKNWAPEVQQYGDRKGLLSTIPFPHTHTQSTVCVCVWSGLLYNKHLIFERCQCDAVVRIVGCCC